MMIINKALYPVSSNLQTITNMHKKLEDLQLQLATGNRYNTLAEMGTDRVHHLNLEARLNRIAGYEANITTVENRLSFYTNGLERLDEIEAAARDLAIPGAYGTDGINLANVKNQATNLLKEVIDVLNTDITGQYIFGGNASDRMPVSSYDKIMNGPNGFIEYVKARNIEDGVSGHGRITTPIATGNAVALTEDNADDFGYKLVEPTTSNATAIAVTTTSTVAPLGYDITFASQPEIGDTITIGLRPPHDRSDAAIEYVTFSVASSDQAVAPDPLPDNTFRLGATPDDTAANFATTLRDRLETLAQTKLRSSSTYAAADGFFVGRNHDPALPQPPMDWYNGQDSSNPRQTVSANIDENTKAQYGVQANEAGFVELIKGLAVFATTDFLPLFDENGERIEENAARYDAMVDIQRGRLSENNNAQPGSIEGITMELGLAASTVNTVKERHTQYTAQLETMLADISVAPREEVAMMLLTLQTQLQASYQATAMASQLTLVNYL